jgi:hypothetical protein
MAKTPTADAFYESFLAKPDPIRGEPTRAKLVTLRECLYANASQIPTTRGGGLYGYLGAIIPAAEYLALPNAAAFVTPVHPGNLLAHGHAGTSHEIADALRAHAEQIRQFEEYQVLMQALRRQIIDTVEEKYIMSLRNKYTRYNAVSPTAMITHLFDTYGKITPEDMLKNEQHLNEPWDGSEPFELVIERIQECIELATEAGRPYSAEQIMDRAFRIVAQTGLYPDDLKEWKKKAEADKTWENYKPFMLDAQRSYRENQQTTKQAGYGMNAEQFDMLANLMTAATVNNNKTDDKVLTEILKRLDNIEKQNESNRNPGGEPKKKGSFKDHGSYCWTHGHRVGPKHNSATCRSKAEGHQDAATRENTMGGNQIGKKTEA